MQPSSMNPNPRRPTTARDSSAIWRQYILFMSKENKFVFVFLSSSSLLLLVFMAREVRLTWRGEREDEEVKDAWPGGWIEMNQCQ